MDHKQKCIAIIALLLALVAISIGGSVITNESIFDIEVNNTNLAPTFAGEPPGTGERLQGTTYYANSTPIQLFVFSHGASSGQTSEIHLLINGTKVADVAGKPLGVAEENNYSIVAMIPRYASYEVEVSNFHHYEWREYRVISGQNGSVITNNYYNTTGGGVDNASLNLKVNKSGDTMTGDLNMSYNDIYFLNYIISNNPINLISYDGLINSQIVLDAMNGYLKLSQGDGNANQVVLYENYTSFSKYIDMNGKNITNCGNCANTTDLNQKVNKSGDNMTGLLDMGSNNITNVNYTFTKHIISQKVNGSSIDPLPDDNCCGNSNYVGQLTSEGNSAAFTFNTFAGNYITNYNIFSALAYNGTPNGVDGMGSNKNIFFIGARGTYTNSSNPISVMTASRATILMQTNKSWNSTSQGTKIIFQTTADGATSRSDSLEIKPDHNIKVTGLAGAGNAYVCVDANGNLFRGSPAC